MAQITCYYAFVKSDLGVPVRKKNGGSRVLILHVEFQGPAQPIFLERMYRYYVCIWMKYSNCDITAMVLYTGKSTPKVRDRFEIKSYGTEMIYIFNAYVVFEQIEAAKLAKRHAQIQKKSRPF